MQVVSPQINKDCLMGIILPQAVFFCYQRFIERYMGHLILYDIDKDEIGVIYMSYKIRYMRGHVEVFDSQGNFLFSADNEYEAENEIREMEVA